jgi:hypothetical protein
MRRLPIFIFLCIFFFSFFNSAYAVDTKTAKKIKTATSSGQVLGIFDDIWAVLSNLFSAGDVATLSAKVSCGGLPVAGGDPLNCGGIASQTQAYAQPGSRVLGSQNEELADTARNISLIQGGGSPNSNKPVADTKSYFESFWGSVFGKDETQVAIEKGSSDAATLVDGRFPAGVGEQIRSQQTAMRGSTLAEKQTNILGTATAPYILGTALSTLQCAGLPPGMGDCSNSGTTFKSQQIIADTEIPTVSPSPALACCSLGTGACAPDTLKSVFTDSIALSAASQICQAESGANADKVTNLCDAANPIYKVGLFQIDMLNVCQEAFAKDSTGAIKKPCVIVDKDNPNNALSVCLKKYRDPLANAQKAFQLSKSGTDWIDWPSAYQCGLGGPTPTGTNSSGGQTSGKLQYYAQTDSQWATSKYPKGVCEDADGRFRAVSISSAGCGPTTMSMVLATYGDKNGIKTGYTPPETIAKLYPNELQSCLGTSLSTHKALLQQNGFETLDLFDIRPNTMTLAEAAKKFKPYLKSGWQIWGNANYYLNGSWPGHFFWVVDVDDSGRIWIMDPWKGDKVKGIIDQFTISPNPKYKAAFAFRKK